MALKQFRPTSPGRRQLVIVDRAELHKGKPVKALTEGLTKSGGRNNAGRVTAFRTGGGHKRSYRVIDFKRRKWGVEAVVQRLEYDPNRTAFIALIKYADGELAYILAPQRLKQGDTVLAGDRVDVKPGNAMPLKAIPVGTIVHNVELKPLKGGADGALGRHLRASRRARRRLRAIAHGLRRSAHGARRLHGHDRGGVEPRQHERSLGQGRPRPAPGPQAERARRRHEPGRSPPWRR